MLAELTGRSLDSPSFFPLVRFLLQLVHFSVAV